jgi:hypothetical protein
MSPACSAPGWACPGRSSWRTGPPHHTEQTIDGDRFTRQHAETLPVAEPPDVQNAVALVRSMLLDTEL